jgi:plasmid stabilization system protein ParE
MPVHQIVIAPAAKTDLKDIYQYGLRQWGQTHSESYLENIKEHFWTLTEQPEAVECWYRMNPELFIKSPDMFRAGLLKNHGTTW